MPRLQISRSLSAGVLLCPVLLAVTANQAQEIRPSINEAQEIRTSVEAPKSIISLAQAPKPQGELLGRYAGDATFAHAPANYHVFSAANVGEDAGIETLTLNFAGETALTAIKSKSNDFVIEPGGTCHEGNVYSSGNSCTLSVRFNPQGPGHRVGFITVANSAEATPMSFGLIGNGYAPVVSFVPSQINSVPASVSAGIGTIKSATNLAIDGGDILYIPDTGNNLLKKMDSTGNIIPTSNSPIATPVSVAADSFGILYTTNTSGSTYYFSVYYPWGSETAYGYAHAAGTCTPSTPCALSAVGMSSPANVSMDNNDNLFFEEGTDGAAEMPVGSISGGSGAFNLWYLSDQFSYSSGTAAPFAVDAYGNLYTKYSFTSTGVCYLLEEPLYNAEYSPTANRVAGGAACGFSGDGGQARGAEISSTIGQIAFDIAGNLYFTDAGNQRVRRIDAQTGIIRTIAGLGVQGYTGNGNPATSAELSNPTGIAVDSQGQVYILSNAPSAGPTQAIRKVGTFGFWVFAAQLKGTTSTTKVFSVANTGNSSLILSANAFFSGANPTEFAIDSTVTNCVLTAGGVLAAGSSCNIGIKFTPSAGGMRSATLMMMDNSVTGSNTIQLEGTGTLPSPTMKITSPTAGSSVTAGTTVTFAVSVTSTATTKPTGTVTFKVNGGTIGSPVLLSSTGTASVTFSEPTAATYTLSATYNGDSNYAPETVTESLIVTAAASILPVQVTLIPVSTPLIPLSPGASQLVPGAAQPYGCGGVSFSVQVSSAGGIIPTGTVQLTTGSSVIETRSLDHGTATLAAGSMPAGLHTFNATYSGDSSHQPGSSAPVKATALSCPTIHQRGFASVRSPNIQ